MDIGSQKETWSNFKKLTVVYIGCYCSCFGFDGYFFTIALEFSNELLIF
jgi:hypothetical protein